MNQRTSQSVALWYQWPRLAAEGTESSILEEAFAASGAECRELFSVCWNDPSTRRSTVRRRRALLRRQQHGRWTFRSST